MTSLTIKPEIPKRGEIWLVNFDPTIGAEIRKTRPAVIISSDAVGKLPIKLIAPITDWKPYFTQNFWHIKIESNTTNGLTKTSAIDALQIRGVDLQRFIQKLGHVDLSHIPYQLKKINNLKFTRYMQASLAITTLDINGEGKTIVVRLSVLLCCIKRRTFVDQQIVIPETFVGKHFC